MVAFTAVSLVRKASRRRAKDPGAGDGKGSLAAVSKVVDVVGGWDMTDSSSPGRNWVAKREY